MFNSIRTKLTLLYTLILAAFMIAIAAVAYYTIIRSADRDLNVRLVEMSDSFSAALTAEQADSKDDPDTDRVAETTAEMRFRDYQFIVYSPEGNLRATTADFEVPFADEEELGHFAKLKVGGKSFKIFRSRIELGDESLDLYVIHSLDELAATESDLARIFLFGFPLTLILAGLCGYIMARRTLSPMVEMGRQAGHISARNLDERLILRNPKDELGQLGTFFNDLLSRLDSAFTHQRRFMADASHELRTPLAIIRGESEVALSKDNRANEDYRDSLAIVHDESERLTSIVEDLFTLARADAGQLKPNFAPMYLDEIVADSVRSITALARKKGVEIEISPTDELPITADEALLRRLFLNLLDNAVKYGRENGMISLDFADTGVAYTVTVSDDGIGIPPEDCNLIFDRFYRADKARGRTVDSENGGAGLGLAIVKWITDLHNGTITLLSSSEKGSSFIVILPK